MVNLTAKEVLDIIKNLSKLEGALIAQQSDSEVLALLDEPTKILTEKFLQNKET